MARDDDHSPSERVVAITGAGRGMGAACARRFALDHGGVFLIDVQADALDHVAQALPGAPTVTCVADIASPSDVHAAIETCIERLGRLDILVNAAGILHPTRF